MNKELEKEILDSSLCAMALILRFCIEKDKAAEMLVKLALDEYSRGWKIGYETGKKRAEESLN